MNEAAPLKTGLPQIQAKGGARKRAGRPATGRTSAVIALRVSLEVGESYGVLTPAQKRSLVALVSSMVKARARSRRTEGK